MFLQRSSKVVRPQLQLCKRARRAAAFQGVRSNNDRRPFHASTRLQVVKPLVLADIGEGIVECEVVQWYVEPGAPVQEFSPLCEVQSDKASVDITSRYNGVIKKLYYEAGEMAKVGKPFVDIDVPDDAKDDQFKRREVPKEEAKSTTSPGNPQATVQDPQNESHTSQSDVSDEPTTPAAANGRPESHMKDRYKFLSTPAVRHLIKEQNLDVSQITGTGKDGRVLKEDVYAFMYGRNSKPLAKTPDNGQQTETVTPLTPTQLQMFKTMTRSLTIPHFLYADEIDFTSLSELRKRLNKVLASGLGPDTDVAKLTYLPFIIKAVSLALYQYPVLNARVDVDTATGKPSLVRRSQHNIGVAMDTPAGLVVPVVKGVGERNLLSIARELLRLQAAAQSGRLAPADLAGGTFTVSNIGNIGGTYLSPVIVEREVAILGVGRVRTVPAFADDDDDGGRGSGSNSGSGSGSGETRVVRKDMCNFSWSADHRVVDGATLARAAGVVRRVVEGPDVMVMQLR